MFYEASASPRAGVELAKENALLQLDRKGGH
jgi:hypothetical protein